MSPMTPLASRMHFLQLRAFDLVHNITTQYLSGCNSQSFTMGYLPSHSDFTVYNMYNYHKHELNFRMTVVHTNQPIGVREGDEVKLGSTVDDQIFCPSAEVTGHHGRPEQEVRCHINKGQSTGIYSGRSLYQHLRIKPTSV